MQPWIARKVYFGLQRLRGEPIARALEDVNQTEFLSVDELYDLQAKRQVEQLRFAIDHVPYYRSAYMPLRDKIMTARRWDDVAAIMAQLPILEKSHVSSHKEQLRADVISELPTYPAKTIMYPKNRTTG